MRRLERGIEHQYAGGERDSEQELCCAGDLVEHAAHLSQDLVGVDDRQVRELAHQLGPEPGLLRRQEKGRDEALRRLPQQGRRHDDKEIYAHRFPAKLAYAGHRRRHRLSGNVEAQYLAKPDSQPSGDTVLDR